MKREAGREFGLVPVESILRVAQVVRKDACYSQVRFFRIRPEPSENVSVCKSGSETEQVYVYSFYTISSNVFRSEKQV